MTARKPPRKTAGPAAGRAAPTASRRAAPPPPNTALADRVTKLESDVQKLAQMVAGLVAQNPAVQQRIQQAVMSQFGDPAAGAPPT